MLDSFRKEYPCEWNWMDAFRLRVLVTAGCEIWDNFNENFGWNYHDNFFLNKIWLCLQHVCSNGSEVRWACLSSSHLRGLRLRANHDTPPEQNFSLKSSQILKLVTNSIISINYLELIKNMNPATEKI